MKWSAVLFEREEYVFSADGANSIVAWGNAPGTKPHKRHKR